MKTNMLPCDRLFVVRAKIKELQGEEAEIKEQIKNDPELLKGNFTVGTMTTRTTKRFDRKAAENELGDLSRFDTQGVSHILKVTEIPNPDAA